MGLFLSETEGFLPSQTQIGVYEGQKMSQHESKKRVARRTKESSYIMVNSDGPDDERVVDAHFQTHSNHTRFINHSSITQVKKVKRGKAANCMVISSRTTLRVVTTKRVQPGEEITLNYSVKDYWRGQVPQWTQHCLIKQKRNQCNTKLPVQLPLNSLNGLNTTQQNNAEFISKTYSKTPITTHKLTVKWPGTTEFANRKICCFSIKNHHSSLLLCFLSDM